MGSAGRDCKETSGNLGCDHDLIEELLHAYTRQNSYSKHATYCVPNISQESYCKMHGVGTLCDSLFWAALEKCKAFFPPFVSTIKLSVRCCDGLLPPSDRTPRFGQVVSRHCLVKRYYSGSIVFALETHRWEFSSSRCRSLDMWRKQFRGSCQLHRATHGVWRG